MELGSYDLQLNFSNPALSKCNSTEFSIFFEMIERGTFGLISPEFLFQSFQFLNRLTLESQREKDRSALRGFRVSLYLCLASTW